MSNSADRTAAGLWNWLGLGVILCLAAAALAWSSPYFSYDYTLEELPARPLAAGMVLVGLVYLTLLPLIRRALLLSPADQRRLLALIIAVGVVMRLTLVWSEPALEDDYQRYMWDGAVTAHGLNPFAISPEAAKKRPKGTIYRDLVKQSGPVHERINHGYLKTIYPPVTQAAFALAYTLKPWSIVAWRAVCLLGEAATLLLLLALLRQTGRSSLWVALYWWNPVVVKELINSAHMEAIVTPFILAAFLLAIRRQMTLATLSLGLAMGAKLWPAMLAPLLWRSLLSQPRRLAFCVALLIAMAGLWALPIWSGGIDKTSGFVAYAQRWKTGSALSPQIEALVRWLFESSSAIDTKWAPLSARALLAGVFGLIVLALAWRPIGRGFFGDRLMGVADAQGTAGVADSVGTTSHAAKLAEQARAADLMRRGGLAVGALLLLSPSQFPWYSIWLTPFLCFMPSLGLLAITAFIPIYYTAFYFIAIDQKEVFRNSVVWFMWVPIWSLLLGELWWRATAWQRWNRQSKDVL